MKWKALVEKIIMKNLLKQDLNLKPCVLLVLPQYHPKPPVFVTGNFQWFWSNFQFKVYKIFTENWIPQFLISYNNMFTAVFGFIWSFEN